MLTQERKATVSVTSTQIRHNDIDWLRVGVVFMLLPYHSARVFDTIDPFYVKNAQLSDPLSWFIIIASPWSMPLLFFLAGAASWYALQFRSGGRYARERFQRLFIPLIFAMLIIIPPQAYFARLSRQTYSASIIQFYPDYFQSINFNKSDYDGTILTMAHLWFIFFLFIFSLVALPLFLYLKTEKGQDQLAKWTGFLNGPTLLLGTPLLLIAASAAPDLLGHPALVYLVIFVLGFVFYANERLTEVLNRPSWLALPLGIGAGLGCLLLFQHRLDQDSSWGKAGFIAAYLITGWVLLVLILFLGRRFLSFSNGLLRYLNRAAYPVYVLHQTIIVIVAYYVVQWPLTVWPKYLAILLISLVISLGLYELVIKRFQWVRFMFGQSSSNK